MFDYICLNCGNKVFPHQHGTESAGVLYDITPLLYGKADASTHNLLLPLLMTEDEINGLIDPNAPLTGEFLKGSMTIKQLFAAISIRMEKPELANITYENIQALISSSMLDSDNEASADEFSSAVMDFDDDDSDWGSDDSSANQDSAPEDKAEVSDIEDYTKNPAFYLIDTGHAVSTNARVLITDFYKAIISPFQDTDGNEKTFTFQIKLHKARIDDTEVLTHYGFRDPNIVNEIECNNVMVCGKCFKIGAAINPTLIASDWAWRYEHIAVGFIGAPNSGKTCLITSILSMLQKKNKMQIHLPQNNNDPSKMLIRNCLNDYAENNCLPKTDAEGFNAFNATVLLSVDDTSADGNASAQDDKKIVTFVDISGECFDMENGTFDRTKAAKSFHMIKICRCYVLCLDPENKEGTGAQATFATNAIHEFMSYQSSEAKTPAPLMITITKSDETENYDDALQFDRTTIETLLTGKAVGFGTDHELAERMQHGKVRRELFEQNLRNNGEKLLRNNFTQFYNSFAENMDFYTSITNCSAYGTVPKPSKESRKTYQQIINDGKYLCISDDGCFLALNENECNDDEFYKMYRGSDKLFHVIRDSGSVIISYNRQTKTYAYNTIPEGYEKIRIDLCSFIIAEGSSEAVIFWNDDYSSVPQPRNIQLITEWILRVCGIRPIWYSKLDDARGWIYDHYLLKGSTLLDIHEFKHPNTALAHCVKSLFFRVTPDDDYILENEGSFFKIKIYQMTHGHNHNR